MQPTCRGHRLYLYSACLHGDGVGIPLATEKPKFAGSFCFGSVDKVVLPMLIRMSGLPVISCGGTNASYFFVAAS